MDLTCQSALQLAAAVRDGQVRSLDAVESYLQRIEATEARLHSFLRVDAEGARRQAERLDSRRAAGETLGSLAGVPVAVKDVLCAEGQPTTCGSRMLESFVPPYDATVVARLREADAVLVGKTNCDEFAMGSSSENSAFGPTHNPWDLERVPGGSSSGAATCIAAGQVPLSIGTDTGGSIRQPAAFCGISGLKPTYGRVSRYGLVAFASSLDQAGPLARSAEDLALLLHAIAGHDPRDTTSADHRVPDYLGELRGGAADAPLAGLRLGVLHSAADAQAHPEVAGAVAAAVAQFEQLGATTVNIELPHARYGVATYYLIAPSEASSNLARYDGAHYGMRCDERELQQSADRLNEMYCRTRAAGFGEEVKRRIMLGAYALSAGYYDKYYLKASQVRRLIRDDFVLAFEKVDLLIGPTTPTTAFRLGEKSSDVLAMYLGDLFTVGANLAGIPAISIPCGQANGLPVGLQLQAPLMGEAQLLRAAHAFQQTTNWHLLRPEI